MFNTKAKILGIAAYTSMFGMGVYMCIKNIQKCKSDIAINKRTAAILDKCDEALKETE